MLWGYKLDIYNSDKWNESEWKEFFRDRLQKMKTVRPDQMFNKYDDNVTALSYYDNEWMLQVNIPLEKTLGEIYMWKTKGKVKYDILPDEQTNVDDLQASKYALQFFLDWNWKNNFWKENKEFKEYKWKYWQGIFYTGIRSYTEMLYKPKEWAEFQDSTDLLNKNKFDKIEKKHWYFFPKAIHPKDFWVDDKAVEQVDVQNAEDCIFKERVTATELSQRYWNNKAFKNIDTVTYWKDPNPINKNSWGLYNISV